MSENNRQYIKIRGASEHNLKNIDLDIPRNEFVVLTGLSGSGKSSLAFDTIYAEGQRRYMESLSSYARQFLGQMEKPNVETIEGLPPAISIDQKSTNRNPRSTVGTVTEIYDYFRLLYARIGVPHCPKCGKEIKKQSVDQMVDTIMELEDGTKLQLLAPVVRGKKGRHEKVLEQAKKAGYVRVLVDGNLYELSEEITLDKNIKHNIEIVVDRLVVREGMEKRLTDSIENVLSLADGLMIVDVIGGEPMNFSMSFACPDCGVSISEIEPRSFSFNNPFGACPVCAGLGYKMEFSPELMIPDKSLSLNGGAISCMGWQSSCDKSSYSHAILEAMARDFKFSLDTPFEELSEDAKDLIINGTRGHVMKVYYKGQRGEGVYDVAFEGLIKDGVMWGRGTLDTKVTFNGVLFSANHLIGQGFVPNNMKLFTYPYIGIAVDTLSCATVYRWEWFLFNKYEKATFGMLGAISPNSEIRVSPKYYQIPSDTF